MNPLRREASLGQSSKGKEIAKVPKVEGKAELVYAKKRSKLTFICTTYTNSPIIGSNGSVSSLHHNVRQAYNPIHEEQITEGQGRE